MLNLKNTDKSHFYPWWIFPYESPMMLRFIITLFQIENEKFIFQKSGKEKYDVIKTVDIIVDLIDSV